jgi:anti-sigma regulatory factor (Ser/Thr protein kinase)
MVTVQNGTDGYVDQARTLRSGTYPIEVSTEFDAGPTAPASARRFVRRTLSGWDHNAVSELVTLLTSELVTNAVLHAGSDVELRMCAHDGILRVEVGDTSPRIPVTPLYEGVPVTGRGLAMVADVSEKWGVERRGAGKVVWFEVRL